MGSHPLRKLTRTLCLSAAIIIAGVTHGHAFTETKITGSDAQSKSKTEAPQLQLEKTEEGTGLSLTTPGNSTSGETELTIPGVGSIGKLPKLDFGLELLYGGGTEQGAEAPTEDNQDDVLIKGKIRHRF